MNLESTLAIYASIKRQIEASRRASRKLWLKVEEELGGIKSDVSEAVEATKKLTDELSTLTLEVRKIKEKLEEVAGRVKELEAGKAGADEVKAVKASVEELSKELSSLESKVGELKKKLEDVKSSITVLEEKTAQPQAPLLIAASAAIAIVVAAIVAAAIARRRGA